MYLTIDRNSQITLIRQIYQAIKNQILTGLLKPYEKLPSTRQLSKELGLSRNVIIEAYDQLIAEGYVEARESAGTFVADGIILEHYKASTEIKRENILGLRHEPMEGLIDFRTGVPNLDLFPKEIWADIYKKICQDLPSIQLDYHEPRGCYDLRFELTHYLRRVRGVKCQPEQVLITTGAAQVFTMLGRLFHPINNLVFVEDPLSHGIIASLEKTNMRIHSIPTDEKGMITDLLPSDLQPSLIFTTPSHQYPMGSVLPIKRRIDLIRYARDKSSYIVEDDYDSEFRYEGDPIESMQSLDPNRVIYVGTFSKILCPALRIGYMILPEHLIEGAKAIKYAEDLHSPVLEQLTLARFIREGYLDKHVRKSIKLYQHKSQLVIKTLQEVFGDQIKIIGHTSGIHLVIHFKDVIFDNNLFKQLKNKGIAVPSVEEHAIIKGLYRQQIMIGYGNLSDEEIVEGITRIYQVLTEFFSLA
ncbi:MAG: GntR family transcriptional regulator [Firmicutes bacterium HGW-Firmicutes-1]|jgi:GntR family transcriptional regulator/MocR family aminotransferase|nr:MAG: GntR family transcriptional regulator [Firmicutes bacterium HGW-Firmicutes-1]